MYPIDEKVIEIHLINDEIITGKININGYTRVSDYMLNTEGEKFIKLYKEKDFKLVNKRNILYIKE